MRTLFILGFSIAVSLSASAADLSLLNQTVSTGTTTVQTQMRLDATQIPLTGIQADVVVSPSLGVAAQLSAAASNANKQLSTSDVTNGKRLLIVGFNQTQIPAGTIVMLTITLPASASGEFSIRLANASGTDAAGKTIPLSTTDATIYVSATSADTMLDRGAFAQVASGGSWKTTFSIMNTSSTLNKIHLEFLADSGAPIVLPLSLPQFPDQNIAPGSTFEWSIPPSGLLTIESEGSRVAPTLVAWARLQSSADLVAFAVFRQRVGEGKDTEAVVLLSEPGAASIRLPFDNTNGFVTGIAIASWSGSLAAQISVLIRDDRGTVITAATINLSAFGHTSFAMTDAFPSSIGKMGIIEFRSSAGPIAVLGLRFNPFGSFTSIPATKL